MGYITVTVRVDDRVEEEVRRAISDKWPINPHGKLSLVVDEGLRLWLKREGKLKPGDVKG